MRSISLAAGIGLLAIGATLGAVVAAQTAGESSDVAALRKEIEALKARQQALEQQVGQLLAALNQARDPQPQNVAINVANAPFKGKPDAKVTMIEFSDFQCPFCGRHVRETMPLVDREYIQTGKVRYVFRDFPIDSLHPQAAKGHEAVNCAGEQGRYWEMWERLFANPRQMSPPELVEHGRAVGVDPVRLKQCLDSGKYTAAVNASVQEAVNLGATGTPIIFLGLTEPGSNTVKAVRVIRGAYPFERFKQVIDSLLTQSSQ
jgi:protein-disulfide isomerase